MENAFPTFPIIFNLVEIWNKSFKILLYYNIQSKIVVTTWKKKVVWTVSLRYFKFLETVGRFLKRIWKRHQAFKRQSSQDNLPLDNSPAGNVLCEICLATNHRRDNFPVRNFREYNDLGSNVPVGNIPEGNFTRQNFSITLNYYHCKMFTGEDKIF